MAMNNPYKQYQQNSITTASPEELTLMLYNGAIKFTKLGKINMEEKKIQEKNNNLIRAQDIIMELNDSLNMDYEVSNELRTIYTFIREKLIDANIQNNPKILEEIIPIIEEMRDTWKEAMVVAKQERLQPETVEA